MLSLVGKTESTYYSAICYLLVSSMFEKSYSIKLSNIIGINHFITVYISLQLSSIRNENPPVDFNFHNIHLEIVCVIEFYYKVAVTRFFYLSCEDLGSLTLTYKNSNLCLVRASVSHCKVMERNLIMVPFRSPHLHVDKQYVMCETYPSVGQRTILNWCSPATHSRTPHNFLSRSWRYWQSSKRSVEDCY